MIYNNTKTSVEASGGTDKIATLNSVQSRVKASPPFHWCSVHFHVLFCCLSASVKKKREKNKNKKKHQDREIEQCWNNSQVHFIFPVDLQVLTVSLCFQIRPVMFLFPPLYLSSPSTEMGNLSGLSREFSDCVGGKDADVQRTESIAPSAVQRRITSGRQNCPGKPGTVWGSGGQVLKPHRASGHEAVTPSSQGVGEPWPVHFFTGVLCDLFLLLKWWCLRPESLRIDSDKTLKVEQVLTILRRHQWTQPQAECDILEIHRNGNPIEDDSELWKLFEVCM